MKKKREYQSSELVKSFARLNGFEDKLRALRVKSFLEDYLDESLFKEVKSINLKEKVLVLRINSSMFRNDLRLRKSFFLKKMQELEGEEHINDLLIL
ncbi:Protein of unknown function [Halpernia humi]|uniref:DUF721 domain-containing protein n=1 Tax=Halpernia humi TaxID=493375 RepID=A0A1H5U1F1_9FLAO|nr:DciA family protein [Halpernia humi]SEF68081.1 Protein of unknown function [Halpernia humi]